MTCYSREASRILSLYRGGLQSARVADTRGNSRIATRQRLAVASVLLLLGLCKVPIRNFLEGPLPTSPTFAATDVTKSMARGECFAGIPAVEGKQSILWCTAVRKSPAVVVVEPWRKHEPRRLIGLMIQISVQSCVHSPGPVGLRYRGSGAAEAAGQRSGSGIHSFP